MKKDLTLGLVGNPNCGKTTVFNALTGARQRVGNWPGVTVERKSGTFQYQDNQVTVVDLPGTYSLTIVSESSSIDERIACEFILNRDADVIVNILDASNLERNLYLTLQLIEMRVPMVIALNMMDVARQRHVRILADDLAKRLGCPVIPLEAHKNKGLNELKQAVARAAETAQPSQVNIPYPREIADAIANIASSVNTKTAEWSAIRLLENDVFAASLVAPDVLQNAKRQQILIHEQLAEDSDILLADARYRFIGDIAAECVIKTHQTQKTWTSRIDSIVLNRILGIPIFLFVMYCMFLFAISIGGILQDYFDVGSDMLFVQGMARGLHNLGMPGWITALLANGIGKGINTVITFVPVIGAMFLFLAFLEDSGYMARAAFVVDRLMRAIGLPGKSFVPMIIGFGCNVPAVMATRTLDNKRDRILTIMMSPFMSCGARLAIFAVFTAAFFPVGGQNVVFALYLIGVIMAMFTGLLLRKTVLQGEPAPLVMELPPYHIPRFTSLVTHAWQRLKSFIFRAGKLIVPICVLIGFLNAINVDGTINSGTGDTHSLLSMIGSWMTPIFQPMGIHQDNWPATVGLVTGILAKEVVVGTLNSLYSQIGHIAIQSGALSQSVYGLMYQRFDGQIGAFAYLLFVLLYFPCISTTAAMMRELNRGWTLFSVVWTTGVAYCVSVFFYQAATFMRHPLSSFLWLAAIIAVFTFSILGFKLSQNEKLEVAYESN